MHQLKPNVHQSIEIEHNISQVRGGGFTSSQLVEFPVHVPLKDLEQYEYMYSYV